MKFGESHDKKLDPTNHFFNLDNTITRCTNPNSKKSSTQYWNERIYDLKISGKNGEKKKNANNPLVSKNQF